MKFRGTTRELNTSIYLVIPKPICENWNLEKHTDIEIDYDEQSGSVTLKKIVGGCDESEPRTESTD